MLRWEVGHCPAFNTSDPQALECLPWNCLCPTLVAVTSKGWQGSLSLDLLPHGSQVLEMHTLKFSTSPCSTWDGWGQNWQSYLGGVPWGHLWDECWFQSLFPFVRVLADHLSSLWGQPDALRTLHLWVRAEPSSQTQVPGERSGKWTVPADHHGACFMGTGAPEWYENADLGWLLLMLDTG